MRSAADVSSDDKMVLDEYSSTSVRISLLYQHGFWDVHVETDDTSQV